MVSDTAYETMTTRFPACGWPGTEASHHRSADCDRQELDQCIQRDAETIRVLKRAIEHAKFGDDERLDAIRHLDEQADCWKAASPGQRSSASLLSNASGARLRPPDRGALMPSAVIRSFNYDEESRALLIVFQSGRRYRYLDVPSETAKELRGAFAKGEYFNAHIRGRFAYEEEPPEST